MKKSIFPNQQQKKVGASVVIDGQPNAYGPYNGFGPGVGPNGFGPGPIGPYGGYGYPGVPIPPGPCGVPFFPPPPFAPFLFDDRFDSSSSSSSDEDDASATVSVPPQTVAPNTTNALILGSALSSDDVRVNGNSIELPIPGTYRISANVTASRANPSTGGNVSLLLNGGVGGGTIATGNIPSGATQVLSGSDTFSTNGRNTSVSVLLNNAGDQLQVLGGTVTVQLIERQRRHRRCHRRCNGRNDFFGF